MSFIVIDVVADVVVGVAAVAIMSLWLLCGYGKLRFSRPIKYVHIHVSIPLNVYLYVFIYIILIVDL